MKHFLFIITIGFVLACCTPMHMDQMERVDYSVLRWENTGFFDVAKFQRGDMKTLNLEEFTKILFFLDKNLTFRITALEYETVDPNDNPVKASGVVFHPLNKKSKGVIEAMPTARVNGVGASDDMFAVEGIAALMGYTVIVPDLLGFGVSREMTAPVLMAKNTGRVTYDLRCAVAQYLWDEFRFQLPAETVIMGYSMGGSSALATQKYYETYHSNTVKVKEVRSGGGACDLPAAFAGYARTGFSEFPAIPSTLFAFNHYYNLDLDFEQIFTGDLLINYPDWFSGNYSFDEMAKLLGSNLHAYMHEDFFKPFDQQNAEFKKLHPWLVVNSVSEGWRPKAPIYLFHAKNDTYVPLASAEEAVKKLRRAGANISFTIYPGGHYTVGYLHFLCSILSFL